MTNEQKEIILKKWIEKSKERIAYLNNELEHAVVEQYQYCLNEEIEKENFIKSIYEEEFDKIHNKKIDKLKEKINEYKEYQRNKKLENSQNYISCSNADIIGLLWILHNEISVVLRCCFTNCGLNKEDSDKYIKNTDDAFNNIIKKYGLN